jgi:hypothetical protein
MWNDASVTPEKQGQYPCAVKVGNGSILLEYRMYFLEGRWRFDVTDNSPYMTPSEIEMEVIAWYDIPDYVIRANSYKSKKNYKR